MVRPKEHRAGALSSAVRAFIRGDSQPYFELEVSADPQFREFVRRRILALSVRLSVGCALPPSGIAQVYIIADLSLSGDGVKAKNITQKPPGAG